MAKLKGILRLFKARLSWQIVFWIFVSIVVIEALILIPSVQRRQQDLLSQLQKITSGKIYGILIAEPNISGLQLLNKLEKLHQDPRLPIIAGGSIYTKNGYLIGTFGDVPQLSWAEAKQGKTRYYRSQNGDRYDAVWSISELEGMYILIICHEASHIRLELYAYMLRIAGLVLIISAFVTLATLIVLEPQVITPILQLRGDLIKAGEAIRHDLPTPQFDSATNQRRNELGEVIAAFEQMFQQITQAVSDRKQAEQKLEKALQKLAEANLEITALNERLKAENLRMAAELDITRQLQQKILPKPQELQTIPGLDIASFMEPAEEVGGDYFDVLNSKGQIKIGIGDVTGHGLESGMLMIMVQTAVSTLLASQENDPARFLSILNQIIYQNVQRMNSDKNLTLALLDYDEGKLRLSGQHEEIIIVRSGGKIERIDTIDLGFFIGLEPNISEFIDHTEIYLNHKDIVVLYTDGVTEAENLQGEQYGLERLCQVVSQNCQDTAAAIKQAVIDDLRQHIGQQKIVDDITLLILKRR